MNETTFNALMVKLQAATWTLHYPTCDTKMFTTKINDQNIMLYNVHDPLYINSVNPDLTDAQAETVLAFVTDTLLVDFASEIQDAEAAEETELTDAINDIIGE